MTMINPCRPLLGIIADDLTGATDVGSALAKGGMRVVQYTGVPKTQQPLGSVDAVIIALKSRSIEPATAVAQSLEACEWLIDHGADRVLFKYCSTFDSTDRGNIGPVAQALMERLGANKTIYCPSFPINGRTVYLGHMFVGDVLLSESGMKNHPINPMCDPDLRRVLARQVGGDVGLVPLKVVRLGAAAVRDHLSSLSQSHIIVDAVNDEDLAVIAEATLDLPLITGGAGIALPIPELYRQSGKLDGRHDRDALPTVVGHAAIISGSCSEATRSQIQHFARQGEIFELDLLKSEPANLRSMACDWASKRLGLKPIMIAATKSPDDVRTLQDRLGVERAAKTVEDLLAGVANDLVDRGVRRLVVAGGETSGAIVRALGVEGLLIGQEIAPGVPWTVSLSEPRLALALKSGNFGGSDFFVRAFEVEP